MSNSTSPVPQVAEGTGAVAKINDLFDAGSQSLIGGVNKATLALLTFGYLGGRYNGIDVANGTVTLTGSATNYIVMKKSDGVVSVSTATTNWNDSADYWRMFSVVTNTTTWTSYTDERSSATGLFGIGQVPVAGFSNPMTTVADIIVGGASGAAARLAKGTAYQVLRMNSGATAQEWAAQVTCIPIACGDEATAITADTAKVTFRMPFPFKLTAVRASLTTAQASGSIFTVDINEGGSSVLSTKLTIDNAEKTSTTAATPAVISDADLADDAEITIDVDQIGASGAAGLKVYLIGYVLQ